VGEDYGITGGTADKLEAIPYYNTNLQIEELKQNIKEIGIGLITQTSNIAPADKKIYALRDVISCTGSTPLIASSIMCKKIALGVNKLVLEVTYGNGSSMKTKKQVKRLAKMMISIGKWSGKETVCVLTNMDEPMGYSVGNSLEVIEAVKALKGEIAEDVKEVVLDLGVQMIKLAGGNNITDNKNKILEVIENGKAYEKFKELVKKQGGDVSFIEDLDKFEKAPVIVPLIADNSGYVEKLDAGIVRKSFGRTWRRKKTKNRPD